MDPEHRFADGSVGHLLQSSGGGIIGLSVEQAGRSLTLAEVTFDPGHAKAAWDCRATWRFRANDRTIVLGTFTPLGRELLYPLDPRASVRCVDVLRRTVETGAELDDGLVEELMLALRHDATPESYAGWVAAHGLEFLTEDGVLARVRRGDESIELVGELLRLDPRTAAITMAWRLTRRKAETVCEVTEQEIPFGHVPAEAYLAPASALADPRFVALVKTWRELLRSTLEKTVWSSDELPMPSDVSDARDATSIFLLMGSWLVDGFPPPKPRAWRPAKSRVERQAKGIRRLGKAALSNLPRGLRDVRAGYRIEGWDLLLMPGLKGAKLGADRLLLRHGKGSPLVLLRSDDEIQNRLKYTIDGDARAMRNLLGWLRELLRIAGFDDSFDIVWPHTKKPERRPVREWLTFGWKEHPFDWRWSADHIEDTRPYWDANDDFLPALSPAKQARIQEAEIPTYYGFYRSVVDPEFVGKLEVGGGPAATADARPPPDR